MKVCKKEKEKEKEKNYILSQLQAGGHLIIGPAIALISTPGSTNLYSIQSPLL
jgi:hypothetical protein